MQLPQIDKSMLDIAGREDAGLAVIRRSISG